MFSANLTRLSGRKTPFYARINPSDAPDACIRAPNRPVPTEINPSPQYGTAISIYTIKEINQ